MPRFVACCVCGVLWDPANSGVDYRSVDNRWWCRNYRACKVRAELNETRRVLAAMEQALAEMENEGWEWPGHLA